ncbi:MAG TPA: cytochrome c oxidase subunit 3 family protein [Candidatus Acidoferrales bacterium]|nr:cytochrome c oxidase subunit 3 family protein [Candidatus Acidoferrales bacterium]
MAQPSHGHDAHVPELVHQFETVEQQREAGTLGMWLFLATEILFFGGMFCSYLVYRSLHPHAFEIGSHLLEVKFGATNTAVLICSSLTMAMAIRSAQTGKSKRTIITYLVITILLGLTFIGVKLYFEWYHDYLEHIVPGFGFQYHADWGSSGPMVQMFMVFYFILTGIHALHMVIGVGILTVMIIMAARGRFSSHYFAPLDISGLYWHFVDIIWIFLFPLLYLIGGRYATGGH